MNLVTKSQIKTIHILLSQWGKARGSAVEAGEKAAIVREYSDGRAESTTCLTMVEAAALITELHRRVPKAPADRSDVMRKKVIAYAHLMKWEREDGRADMDKLDAWCKKRGLYHKGLNEHTAEELPRLITQMEAVYQSFLLGL